MDPLEKKLEKFECQRCNECCKKPGYVYLRPEEADRIAGFLGLEPRDFINDHCELLERRRLVLKKNPNESCIFLTETGCQIHPVKPQQCRDFPVKWRTEQSLSYCVGLKKLGLGLRDKLGLTGEMGSVNLSPNKDNVIP